MSLVYIGLVVLLHIYSKVSAEKVQTPNVNEDIKAGGGEEKAYSEETLWEIG